MCVSSQVRGTSESVPVLSCGHIVGHSVNLIFFHLNSVALSSYLDLTSHLETYIISSLKKPIGSGWSFIPVTLLELICFICREYLI